MTTLVRPDRNRLAAVLALGFAVLLVVLATSLLRKPAA